MSSLVGHSTSTAAISTLSDMTPFQLCLLLQSAIPRLDVLHKIVNFIKITKLDGKTFMGLNNKRLADLASHDPLIINQFQDLRVAQPQAIQLLLESRRGRPLEPTKTTQGDTSYGEVTHGEETIGSVSNLDTQSHPTDVLPVPSNPDSHNPVPDSGTIIEVALISTDESVNTQTSTDAAHDDQNRSSLNRESPTHHPDAHETIEPAVETEVDFTSPLDPHSVPLPQLRDSELDLLDDEEVFSAEEAIGSELEADGLLSSEYDTSDDESQAWSLVGDSDEELGEPHVSIENEVEQLHGVLSPFDVTDETHIEHPSVTPEDSSGSTIVSAVHVDASSAVQPSPVDDQIISAGIESTPPSGVSDPDGTEVENINQRHENDISLPMPTLPAEDDDSEQGLPLTINDDLPTSMNSSEPETAIDAKELHDSKIISGSVDTGQSSPDSGPDPPQTVTVVEQPSASPFESVILEDDQANTASATDEILPAGPSNMEENLPEATHSSDTVPTEEPSEPVIDVPPEEQPNFTPGMDLEEASEVEQPLPSLSNPVSDIPLEVHGSASGVHPIAEESDPSIFEAPTSLSEPPAISTQNDDISVAHAAYSPVEVSVELDMSASASPSSSTRSVFSDSPFPNRLFPDFHLLSPVSPVMCLDKCNVLLFCEGVCNEDYNAFLTSTPIDVTQMLPFSSRFAGFEEADHTVGASDDSVASELLLVDHPLPINDDIAPDDSTSLLSLEDFFYDPLPFDESMHYGEPASSSDDNLIDFLDEPAPIEVHSEGLSASESISPTVEPPLVDEDRAETGDPESPMDESVPAVPLPAAPATNEQLSDNNQVEASMPFNEAVQQASDEATSVEPSEDCTPVHVIEQSRFKGLPPIDTSITSLIDDLSAYMSPEDCNTYNPIVHASSPMPSSSRSRLSHGSPTRTLFPMRESVASDRTIANYTKRLHEAIERPAVRSSIAIQADLENQDLQLQIQDENSTTSNVASASVLSPLSILSSSFLQLFGLGPQPEQQSLPPLLGD